MIDVAPTNGKAKRVAGYILSFLPVLFLLADAVGKAISLGLKAVDLGFSEKIIKGAVSVIRAALSEKKARRLEIFALISREELLFTNFKESREMVAEFLEENGYPQIKDAWDDGDDAADALPGKMATDGQKADASEVAKELKDAGAEVKIK